ncbi:uncharacterized protein LOC143043789 [Mytilus galloprovincialis]|uniref:uncharacterized protein LOC143043789 n=1 Tax=Mytilus galloprovincialis TaxID=29158 RepID=UPI003F7C69AA
MDQFEKLHSFEDGRRSIILRWDGNNAKCRIPKFIEIGHATGAFIPSESYGGHAMQTGVPSSGNVFNKMMNYVSSAVSCKTYGNQEYEVEDNEVLGTPHSTLRAKNIDNKMTPQVHFKSEEDNDDITSGDEDSSEENDLHICGWCKCEFAGLSEFFRHKLRCSRNNKTEEVCCSGGTLAATGGDEYNAEIVFENVNYEWSEKAVKKKFKLQKHNHLGFRLTHKEKGSLILWTKLSGRILKDEDTFTTCFEQFVTQILRQCPLVMDKYVGIRITITIVEWLADYHNNDNDLMRCGRCYNEFHYLNAFSDHKGLKCLKRTAEQIAEIGDLDIDSRVLEVTDRIDIDAKIQTETNTRLVIAGIDFGTTYSGYAHCLRTDYRANKKKQELKFPHWKRGDGRASYKAPNCILFKPDMSFHSFGYDAVNNCLRFINNEEVDEWFYFDNFKMVLYNEKSNQKEKVKSMSSTTNTSLVYKRL